MTDQEKVKRAQLIASFREKIPAMVELAEIVATRLYAEYRAYLKAGFTEQQALELCCKRP